MARAKTVPLYIGIGSHVVALDTSSGDELWRTKTKSSSYVTVCVIGDRVYAGAGGELFCLNATSGLVIWRNKLKGLGTGLVAFAGAEVSASAMMIAQAAGAAANGR